MRKKLSAIGKDLGVVIDRDALDRLGLDRDAEVDVRVEGGRLVVEPLRSRRERVTAAVRRAMAAHDETLRKLAQ